MWKPGILLVGLLCACGCSSAPNEGSVKANRKDGEVTSMEVRFPGSAAPRTAHNRQEADKMISHLEGLLDVH